MAAAMKRAQKRTKIYKPPPQSNLSNYYLLIPTNKIFVFNRRTIAQHTPGLTAINKQNTQNTHTKILNIYTYICSIQRSPSANNQPRYSKLCTRLENAIAQVNLANKKICSGKPLNLPKDILLGMKPYYVPKTIPRTKL